MSGTHNPEVCIRTKLMISPILFGPTRSKDLTYPSSRRLRATCTAIADLSALVIAVNTFLAGLSHGLATTVGQQARVLSEGYVCVEHNRKS